MKFHIVQLGERIDDILFLYNLERDELIERNRHIRSWEKLIPGTKLKIPVITEEIDQEVISMEPFIEDYYPKAPSYDVEDEELSSNVTKNEETIDNDSQNPIQDINILRENNEEIVKEEAVITNTDKEKQDVKTEEQKETKEQLHLSKQQSPVPFIYPIPYPFYQPPLYFYPFFYPPNYYQKK